ncbi:MAG TPA: ABC transporter permease [Chitinophagaceae bacterium]|nr:ABC transporter permease [Chitinophagaceae bacterium]
MIQTYFKQFKRNIAANKTYSLLNIVGLSAGLTCFAFIFLWVADEISYDKFNDNYNTIVRLVSKTKTETGVVESAVSSAPMAQALKHDYPEVENTVRLRMTEEIVTFKNQQVLQPGILLADPSFFQVFSYQLSRGSEAAALSEPFSLVLTQSTAKKYFGDKDPIGETLLINMYDSNGYGALYKISGIMPDPPKNAHFTFTMLASFKTVETVDPDVLTTDGWGDGSFYTYLLLRKGVDSKAFSAKISQFYAKYVGDMYPVWRNIYSYKVQPLGDIHLRSNLQYEIAPTGSIAKVYIFSVIGIFILLLAGINYTNLATARATARAKEVGIKKVVGAGKGQLIFQYLSESVFTAFIALIISFLFSLFLQPYFYQLTGKTLSLFSSPILLCFLAGTTFLLGLLSGVYPAIILSGFKPAGILKGSFKSSEKGVLLRKTLIVSQFTITIILITGITIIYSQMSFIRQKDLGYNKDALLFLRVNGNTDVINGYEAFKNELEVSSLVSGVATSNSMIVGGLSSGGSETVDKNGVPLQVNTSRLRVDKDYIGVYGLKLLAGQNFSRYPSNDTIRQVLLNETAVKKFGWTSNEFAIGKPFKIGNQEGTIIGVVNNFHFNSLEQAIEPLAIYPLDTRFSRITLKVDMGKATQALAFVKDVWKKHFTSALFDYDFVSQELKQQYRSEEKFSKIFLYFSILSLLIASLGLYGLISFTIFQKTKEIGIRKVLGASANRIAGMLSGNFLKLIILASLIAMPVAWYAMNQWLRGFAYRINMSWWMFGVAVALVFFVAIATTGFRAIKAATSNPVKSLRTE